MWWCRSRLAGVKHSSLRDSQLLAISWLQNMVRNKLMANDRAAWNMLFKEASMGDVLLHRTSVLRTHAMRTCFYNTFERGLGHKSLWLLRHQSFASHAWDGIIAGMFFYLVMACPLYIAFRAPEGDEGVIYSTTADEGAVEWMLLVLCIVDVLVQVRAVERRGGERGWQ